MKFLICFVVSSILLFSCDKNKDVNALADSLCSCAQPIVEWRQGLEYHYEKLSQGTIIQKQVDSCLTPLRDKYADRRSDDAFKKAVVGQMQKQCPAANTTIEALFIMLFDKEKN
jgi:hypothetical protein